MNYGSGIQEESPVWRGDSKSVVGNLSSVLAVLAVVAETGIAVVVVAGNSAVAAVFVPPQLYPAIVPDNEPSQNARILRHFGRQVLQRWLFGLRGTSAVGPTAAVDLRRPALPVRTHSRIVYGVRRRSP